MTSSLKYTVLAALFAALTAVGGYIAIPIGAGTYCTFQFIYHDGRSSAQAEMGRLKYRYISVSAVL